MRYQPAEGISFRQVDHEIVVLDLNTGEYFSLNPTAAFIWTCLVENKGGPEEYAAAFKITVEQARADFTSVAADFVKRGLLKSHKP